LLQNKESLGRFTIKDRFYLKDSTGTCLNTILKKMIRNVITMEPTDIIKTKDEILPLIHNNSVPKIVWCYWAIGPMNDNRIRSIEMMKDNMGESVCLITSKNLESFVVEGFPLHDTFS
jgi:hypothetical protein